MGKKENFVTRDDERKLWEAYKVLDKLVNPTCKCLNCRIEESYRYKWNQLEKWILNKKYDGTMDEFINFGQVLTKMYLIEKGEQDGKSTSIEK